MKAEEGNHLAITIPKPKGRNQGRGAEDWSLDGPVCRFGSPAKRLGALVVQEMTATYSTAYVHHIVHVPILGRLFNTPLTCYTIYSPLGLVQKVTRSSPPSSRAARRVFIAEPSETVSAHSGYVQMNAPEKSAKRSPTYRGKIA
jgi:hypothetical protein